VKKVIISSFIILILIGFYAVRRYYILPRSYHEDPLTTIQIEQNVFDFDTIEFKNDVYCNFKITNTGNHPLVIKFVEVSCGCTVPEFGKKPIAKDSTITIRVNYHPMKPGQFFEKIFVFCNSKNSPHFLNIKGFVLPSDTLNQPN
jgi:cytochrome c oxidase assembly protein Cox11